MEYWVAPVVTADVLLCKENVASDSHILPETEGRPRDVSFSDLSAACASFDDPNLVARAGPEPVMGLAEAAAWPWRRPRPTRHGKELIRRTPTVPFDQPDLEPQIPQLRRFT
jgi:hypothetical protein